LFHDGDSRRKTSWGSPLAGWLLEVHWLGIPGCDGCSLWKGIRPYCSAFLRCSGLTDWPAQAGWLPRDEQEWIMSEIQRERETKNAAGEWTVTQALSSRQS